MCGIAGWVDFGPVPDRNPAVVDAMTETMSCRGPDAAGTWMDPSGRTALGHRRLAVIDIEGGVQPMAADTSAGSVVLSYSGEVYNYVELRTELRARGHRFRTASDTEVVLRGFLEWGEAVAERLNGMFAFAVWDGRNRELVLVRDRMGIKPLYHYRTERGTLFGSEPKAILAHPAVEAVVDLDGLRELFSFVKTPGQAVWSGLREVLPGTVLTVSERGVRERVYWSLPAAEHREDGKGTIARVRELLEDIVARQSVADVPRCLLLSGGLDSSSIAALSTQQLAREGEKLRTFAVEFTGQERAFVPDAARPTLDAPYVREMADHLGSVHENVVLDTVSLADSRIRRAVLTARDAPMGTGDTDASLYQLFREVRKHSTVALSGEGADELFGGYGWHQSREAQISGTFPWLSPESTRYGRDGGVLRPELLEALDLGGYIAARYADAVSEVDHLPGDDEATRRSRTTAYLGLTRALRLLLDRKDRLSMAVGLEVRVPFLDHRLVEYVYNTPWPLKSFDGKEKSLLRAAIRDVLPDSIADRRKSAYPAARDPAYLRALRCQARELAADREHPVFELVSRSWLTETARDTDDLVPHEVRSGLERCLNLATWLEVRRPRLVLS